MTKKAPLLVSLALATAFAGSAVLAQDAAPEFEAFDPVFNQIAGLSYGPITTEGTLTGEMNPDGTMNMTMGTSSGDFRVQVLHDALANTIRDLPTDFENRDAVVADMREGMDILDQLIEEGEDIVTLNSDSPVFGQLYSMIDEPTAEPTKPAVNGLGPR